MPLPKFLAAMVVSAVAMASVVGSPAFSQTGTRPTPPSGGGGGTPPPDPTDPIPPRPSTSGVSQNSGGFVNTIVPRVSSGASSSMGTKSATPPQIMVPRSTDP
jgi:hypothetical protein